jgi:hypothetical protein
MLAAAGILALPAVALAQGNPPSTAGADNLGNFLLLIVYVIDRYIVPVVFALAFIVFLWGIYSTFIAGATNDEKRQEGQKLVLYGLIGFVLMFSVWGLVNLLVGTLGFNTNTRPPLPQFDPTSGSAATNVKTSPFTPGSNAASNNTPTAQDLQNPF